MEPTDIELMLRVRDGEVAAFRELVARYREPLRRFFAAVLPDRSQAEDFAQETFLRLWIARERYEPTGKFSSYLFQIARHYWLNQRKKLRFDLPRESIDPEFQAGPLSVSQLETILLQEYRMARIRRAIAALPDHYRAVFEMSHVEGLRYAEIACRLDIPRVLSSLVAHSALGGIQRLKEIGVDPSSIAHALAGVISRRLVRKPCPECLTEYEPDPMELQALGLSPANGPFRRGAGCEACRRTGCSGRVALAEVLELDDAARRRIVEGAPMETLWQETFGRAGGSLRDDARDKVCQGLTTVEEAARALFDYPFQ